MCGVMRARLGAHLHGSQLDVAQVLRLPLLQYSNITDDKDGGATPMCRYSSSTFKIKFLFRHGMEMAGSTSCVSAFSAK